MSVPVHLLSGFLGSGKTTLLNALLREPRMTNTAVLVNEIGTIGIDHDLVVGGSDDMLLLEGGCLCCQPRGSVADALARLLSAETPERILIETSGAANPVPVIETLALTPILRGRTRFAGMITVADAVFGADTLDEHEEARLQIACADHIVLSKLDLPRGRAGEPALSAALDELNSHAIRHRPAPGTVPSALVDELAAGGGAGLIPIPERSPDQDAHHGHFDTVALTFGGRLEPGRVEQWLGDLLDRYGAHLLRVKGLLQLHGEERPAVLQCVRDVVHPVSFADSRGEDEDNRVVLIASGIHPELLQEALQELAQMAAGDDETREGARKST